MVKTLNDIFEWLIQSGLLVGLFSFAWRYIKPWLADKQAHASAEQSKAFWELLEKVADTAVTSLISADKTGDEKFISATHTLINNMKEQGYKIDEDTAMNVIQAAYNRSNLTDNKKGSE